MRQKILAPSIDLEYPDIFCHVADFFHNHHFKNGAGDDSFLLQNAA